MSRSTYQPPLPTPPKRNQHDGWAHARPIVSVLCVVGNRYNAHHEWHQVGSRTICKNCLGVLPLPQPL
jgi:hypothetical protein